MLTIESFCNSILGTTYAKVLRSIKKDDYLEFEIPKKNGCRKLCYLRRDAPLWTIQHSLLTNFLDKQPLPVCVKGFVKGESYVSFLSEHIGAQYFLRLDISNFFPSITTQQVKKGLSRYLLCESDEDKEKVLDLVADIVTVEDRLPQGACTSPAVSNLIMCEIDQRITKYCQLFNIRYTRYADDLLFSSSSFDFATNRWFIRKIKLILKTYGLLLNYSKQKFGKKQLILNGYVISRDEIRLSRNRLCDIRHVLSFSHNHYSIANNDEETFLKMANSLSLKHRDLAIYPFNSLFQFVQYLCGYRAFLISITDSYVSTPFQKDLQRLIRRIEREVMHLV